MMTTRLSKLQIKNRIAAAEGKVDCDLIIRNVTLLDVFNCEWRTSDVCIHDGVIVAIDQGLKATRYMEGVNKWLVPGWIDAHVHIESSLLTPTHFEKAVLPLGTTTAICDPHELANVVGVDGIKYFLEASENLNIDLWVMLSSCVPATHLETNGGGKISARDLIKLATHPKALGLAEVMNVPGVLSADEDVIDKLEVFSGGAIDGHCPLLRGQALSAYAASGISSCHETTQSDEAIEKLSKGISIWIREGSVAKDLNALAPLLTMSRSMSMGFCTDDRNPLDTAREGHLDYLIRSAIKSGVAPEVAYRAASLSVARHYGLKYKGAIAPGYEADLVLLSDYKSVAVDLVLKNGIAVPDLRDSSISENFQTANTMRAQVPQESDLIGKSGLVHIIEVKSGKIITGRRVGDSKGKGIHSLSVLARHGTYTKPANGYVHGFGDNFSGAIASSVGHDSHNLIVVGRSTKEMVAALAALLDCGGGFCVVKDAAVLSLLPLPFGGLMSLEPASEVTKQLMELEKAARYIGCELTEPFLQLAFLSLPVIPSLKLTDLGLVDVDAFKIIDVSAT